ncbi:MAG: UDP-N-acetylmuramoyl-tripeptide--D-alanyl-D-alanine ligase [Gammaproteobacteria bacterium]|nr:MAG: UDP-N-acetylmuramoyl-tripeptide--D-alanyl-D-alanine ligase [Gammaproteobacteria bacterium]
MMGHWTLADVVRCTDGWQSGEDCAFDRVVTDSRQDCTGALFVALEGPRFDGHDHVRAAIEAGAVAAMTSREVAGVSQVVVRDTLSGLQALAAANRQRFDAPVLALTGSAGKTTVKEMCRTILGGRTWATPGNLNNHVGVPLTLLGLDDAHAQAVVELGANHVGEIARLVALVRPRVAVVTSVGLAHVGEFGGPGKILQAKSEIFSGLDERGTAILPANQPYTDALKQAVPGGCRILTFGRDATADVAAEVSAEGTVQVFVEGAHVAELKLALPGLHSVDNALAAIAGCLALGVEADKAVRKLAGFRGQSGRLAEISLGAVTLIDDTYNANPEAMLAALDVLAARREPVKVAVLGAMAELGDHALAQHQRVLEAAQAKGIQVVRVGDWPASLQRENWYPTPEAAADWLLAETDRAGSPVAVLVKGSRSARMEKVVDFMKTKRGLN